MAHQVSDRTEPPQIESLADQQSKVTAGRGRGARLEEPSEVLDSDPAVGILEQIEIDAGLIEDLPWADPQLLQDGRSCEDRSDPEISGRVSK